MFSTAEALLCGTYTPLGQVQIGPLDSLAGQLVTYQIPDSIISTLKIADLAVTSAKLSDASVTLLKIANAVITNAKIDAAAGIIESKLSLTYGTQALHDDIATRVLAATYAAHNHSIADPTQIDHANLINVLASQHHVKTTTLADLTDHNKANHDSLGLDHANLSNVLTSQHHVKTTSIADLTDHNKANHDALGLSHDSLVDVSVNDHHAQAHTLASHSTKDHSELTNVLTSQHHVKTVSGEISLADLLEKNHANLTNVLASQHHPKYLDSEAVSAMGAKGDSNPLNHDRFTDAEALAAAVKSESFGSGWSGETKAPTEGTTYDHLNTKSVWPTVHFIYGGNGATVSAAYGATVKMPISDADCYIAGSIRVPDWWPSGRQAYLKVLYYPTVSSQAYSVEWSVGANGVGDSIAHTILVESTGYDFPAGTGSQFARLSVDIGTSLSAQDVLTFTCSSDASNSTEIRIFAIWISTSSG